MALYQAVRRGHASSGTLRIAYTTCPACAKAYGHNDVVVFAKVADRS